MEKRALITGTTSGIGKAIAMKFAENGYHLIITGRRQERLTTLKDKLKSKYNIEVIDLCFDVREKTEVQESLGNLATPWNQIDVLVNNAGLASGLSTIQDADIDDWERMIDTNIKGLLYVSRTVMPMMVDRKQGHIINIGSIAGKEVYPKGNVYCGTKHAVDAITKAMRIDALEHNIKVTQIAPGAVETEFSLVRFKGDKQKADNVYKGFEPLHAEDIAEVTWFVVSLPAHVNVNDMLVMPTAQANSSIFNKDTT